ncbi:MAG TPA: hypothetical protein VF593_08610 [Chthoniobacteraceae bacterium]|jgi:hypothetical protein
MKSMLIWIGVVSGLMLSGCDRQPKATVEVVPEEEVSVPVEKVVAVEKPEVPKAVPLPEPEAPKPVVKIAPALAPPGVFFLMSAASVETSDGIMGLRPGTRVQKQPDGRYLAEGNMVTLRPDQLTNDLEFAKKIIAAEASVQAARRQSLQAVAAAEAALEAGNPAAPAATDTPEIIQAKVQNAAAGGAARGLDSASLNGSGNIGRKSRDNKGRVFIDSTGRRFWKGTNGETRYDF